MLRSAIITVAALAASPVAAENYSPRDECVSITGAAAFHTALADAVKRRDERALLALVSKDVLLDFGGGSGHAELRARLDDEHYRLWLELAEILKLGCASHDGSGLTMPWYFAQDIEGIDPFAGYLVTGSNVALRAAPDGDAEVLERVSWSLVIIDYEAERSGGYVAVSLPSGAKGYIHDDYLRSFVDYRILAEKTGGKWLITAFVAGD